LTTWLQIEQAVASQIQNIKANAVKDRIRTPLYLDRAQYQACFGFITNTALRLVDLNYTSTEKPLKPCTGVFTTTTGLPCEHRIEDIREARDSLRPSIRCTVNIRQLQAEFTPHESTSSTSNSASQVIPRATVQAILNSASQSSGQSALQSALQSILDLGSQLIPKATIQRILEAHPAPPPEPSPELSPEPSPDTRPIWPGRPELIYKQYLIEKEAWLTSHHQQSDLLITGKRETLLSRVEYGSTYAPRQRVDSS
jgi:histone H3/H4